MAFFDLGLQELQSYRPRILESGDFEEFWTETIAESQRKAKKPARFVRIMPECAAAEIYDVEFPGFAGQPVKGWYLLPAKKLRGKAPLACVVTYIGYGGGRGLPHQWLLWPSMGHAVFVMDTRGQGSVWQPGDTPDPELEAANPQTPGFMTRGIVSPWHYYYRRVFADAVLAVHAVAGRKEIDPARIVTEGGSQGGGISLAASGILGILAQSPAWKGTRIRPAACLADVPFLCHFQRACTITNAHPYQEIATYLRTHRDDEDLVYATLSYFDGVLFAKRIQAPGLFSVGLMDDICPPSTVYAAYNAYAGRKEIRVYSYNGHEGGGEFQTREKLTFIRRLFAPPAPAS